MNKINRLKSFRVKNNITQQRLAAVIGCSQATISHVEKNIYPTVKSIILYKLKKIGLNGNPLEKIDFNVSSSVGTFKIYKT